MEQALLARVRAWIDGDPNSTDRDELTAALERGDEALLEARFAGRLSFGTAGLRGPIGAGPAAMNAAVIRQTAHGLADVLLGSGADPARGVVVGFDARHRSREFADETAGALRARGIAVHLWDRCTPTPSTPFMLRRLGALAGVQVTASHNPPQDNGFKVYWDHAAQIIPPVDGQIAAAIKVHAAGPASALPILAADASGPALNRLGHEELAIYHRAVQAATPAPSPATTPFTVVYTAMHGVGGDSIVELLGEAGVDLHCVEAQQQPDGSFPTVAFPNPEEDGAMDMALDLAGRVGADMVIANDPDADRLAVALPDGEGYSLLNGNEIGLLLGDWCLEHSPEGPGLVAASVVSSEALGALAEAYGKSFAQALTGFKWIMAEARRAPETPFIFGYEEALGYCVGREVADKDGLSAALAFVHMGRTEKAAGSDLQQRLSGIYARIGAFVSDQWVQRFAGLGAADEMASAVQKVRSDAPERLGDLRLVKRADFESGAPWDASLCANMVALNYRSGDDGLRVLVRPSGTEPKVKTYFEYRSSEGVVEGRRRLAHAVDAWCAALETT